MPLMFRSNNLAARIFERQISSSAPGTSVNRARRFYENIFPNDAIHLLDFPSVTFHKFTEDGNYLITFPNSDADIAVYRPTGLSYSCRGDSVINCDVPYEAYYFESFFTELCCISLDADMGDICEDFFLYSEKNQFGIFATSELENDTTTIPVLQITFLVVRLEDGEILSKKVFYSDHIILRHSMGVSLYDDLVAITSLLHKRIHIFQISDSGKLKCLLRFSSQDSAILDGIIFQDYADSVIWMVQFLDRHHLLIKFGSVDGVMQRDNDDYPAFFVVYNMETTQIIPFYQDSADELCKLFELYCNHFHSSSKNSFLSTHSNNIYALEQFKCNETEAGSRQQFVKNILATLPIKSQSQSPSPYFDHSLFRYDEKLISATYLHNQLTGHQIEFTLRRQPNTLFKIISGFESENARNPDLKSSSYLFHPILPLAISIQDDPVVYKPIAIIHYRSPLL